MVWFIVGLLVVHLIGTRIVARRYFARRHGVSLENGEPGSFRAVLVGMAWPASIFVEATRSPERCNHHGHILGRDAG
jgi:uncharacterized protein YqgC (DUF456 family)